jgi:glycosyltransferase involved in cell wall biosynthesis
LRILHVISGLDPQNGGPTTALVGLAAAQVAIGMDVTVLATWKIRDGFPVADDLRSKGVNVVHVGPAKGKLSTHPMLRHHATASAAAADIVHIHGLFEDAQHHAARAAQRLRIPYVITPHGMLSPWNMSRNRLFKRIYLALRLRKNLNQAAAIHFTSDVERDMVAPLALRPKAIVQRLGLDLSEFRDLPAAGEFRRHWPQLGERPFVLFLGRIDYKKGLDVLIPAFAAARLGDVPLVIAGPDRDGYEPAVREMVAQHGLNERVIFTGMLRGRERLEAYVDAALFALTSHQENFGITIIEAIACACPVLISDQVNIHAQVTAASAGEVIPANVERTARALEQWMASEPPRRAAGARGRAWALDHFDWRSIAEEWRRHYQSLRPSAQAPDPSRRTPS